MSSGKRAVRLLMILLAGVLAAALLVPGCGRAGRTPPSEEAAPVEPAEEGPPPVMKAPTETLDEDGLPILKRYPDIDYAKGETLLQDVKDYTFSYDEAAFYWLVKQVHGLPEEKMEPGKERVGYSRLMQVPQSYRGHAVTIEGTYVRVDPWIVPIRAMREAGIERLYACFLEENVPGEVRPMATVHVLEDPMTYLHKGDRVAVRGYFYKVWQYETLDGRIVASPLLIGRRLVKPGRVFDLHTGGIPTGLVWMLVVFIAAIIVMMAIFFMLKRMSRHSRARNPFGRDDKDAGSYRRIRRP